MTEQRVLAELLVTTRGWDHPGWQDSFYPDDLPEDWRLAYFANSFAAVLLPASLLSGLEVATIRDWLAEIEGDFVFYLEADTSSDKLAAFAGRLAGILAESATQDVRVFKEDKDISLPNAPNSSLFVSNDGEECFCLYRPSMELTMRELRVDIEAILAASKTAKRCVLCWDTKSPLAGVLENAKVIAELLGA
jgi:hypothetical protein